MKFIKFLIISFFIIISSLSTTVYANDSNSIFIPQVTAIYQAPKEFYPNAPIAYSVTDEEVVWNKTYISQNQDSSALRYNISVFENLDITSTQNFQLGIEVYVLNSEQDAKDGYESLQVNGTFTKTFNYIADEALYTEIDNDINKGILKIRIKNVVWVLEVQGYPEVFDNQMLFSNYSIIKEKLK